MKVQIVGKTKSGKYKVKVDDTLINTYDDVLINNKLIYKKEIDNDMLTKINKDNIYYDAYNKTLSYILKHQRALSEVIEYLDKFEISDNEKNKIIDKLKSNGLINDIQYVRSYISDSINLSKDGPNKIKKYLLDKNIDEMLIDEELSKIDEDILIDKVLKFIKKKFDSNTKYSKYQLKQKISLKLINLGYDKDLIDSLINNFDFNENDLLEKEYNKIYNKLSKKYNGYELSNKIKQKLYAKGFDINLISDLIQKKDSF